MNLVNGLAHHEFLSSSLVKASDVCVEGHGFWFLSQTEIVSLSQFHPQGLCDRQNTDPGKGVLKMKIKCFT